MRKTDAASFQNTTSFITLVIIEWIISCYRVRNITLSIPDNTVSLIMFAIILERYLTPFLTNKGYVSQESHCHDGHSL